MLGGLPAEFVFSCGSSRSAAALTISTKLCAQLALHLSQPINAALWGKRLAMECLVKWGLVVINEAVVDFGMSWAIHLWVVQQIVKAEHNLLDGEDWPPVPWGCGDPLRRWELGWKGDGTNGTMGELKGKLSLKMISPSFFWGCHLSRDAACFLSHQCRPLQKHRIQWDNPWGSNP